MDDTKLENRLRQTLRAEADAVPLTVTGDQLDLQLRLRRSERANRRLILSAAAALVLAVGAAGWLLLSNRATTPLVGGSPEPSGSPSESVPAMVTLVPSPGWTLAAAVGATPVFADGGINTVLPVGDTRYGVIAACIGADSPLILVVEGDKWEIPCTGQAVGPREFPQPAAGYVEIQPLGETGMWYEVLLQVPETGLASPSGSIAPVADIAPYLGWKTLDRLIGPDGDAEATVKGAVPSGVSILFVSAACEGTGSLAITMTGDTQLAVDCPAASTKPSRIFSDVGDATEFQVDVVASGTVSFQVLVEGSDLVLQIPPVVLRAGTGEATMGYGCGGVISLAWGYDAGDSCATTLPSTPLETLDLPAGDVATLSLVGWTFSDVRAACGHIVTGAADEPSLFEEMAQCTVTAPFTDSTITVRGLPKGANPWVLEVHLTARNAVGDSFSGPFYAYVQVP